MKRGLVLSLLLILFFQNNTKAQRNGGWTQISTSEILNGKQSFLKQVNQGTVKAFQLDETAFRNNLKNVLPERVTKVQQSSSVIQVPDVKGTIKSFRIVEASVMQPELALKYPQIKTYLGKGIEDPSSTIRFDISPNGFHAMILSAEQKTIYINPVDKLNEKYIVFNADKETDSFQCKVVETPSNQAGTEGFLSGKNADDNKLRTYRLALAVNGEFSQDALDGTEADDAERKAKVLSVLVTNLARVDAIYERDFGIRMQLVAKEDTLIYLDPDKDPFAQKSKWNEQIQQNLDSVIGNDNYDIGHLLGKVSTSGDNDGNAGCIACVCEKGAKGSGYTAHVDIVGDPLVVDYWAHEMGHQFGATHTFTFQNEGTDSQMEPGSGSTIMGYAGITGNSDIQPHSDDYFHAISIQQITDNIKLGTGGGKCAEIELSDNHPPSADAGKDYTIPKSTPFVLTGNGSDTDANDVLTYCWEQFDNYVRNKSSTIPSVNNTMGPAFRSIRYSTSNTRFFPSLETILAGKTSNKWEVLPAVQRELNFRLTVRDNHPGDGNNRSDDMVVTVDSSSGPFLISNLNNTDIWGAGDFKKITWKVANTNNDIVNCHSVNIELSVDGGKTFPVMLAANTANDGEEFVQVPELSTSAARIRISAVNNIFFDISNKDISISTALPLHFLSFNANKNNTAVDLKWSTSNETNVVSYAIERSTDGINFTEIGFVDAGKKQYLFTDYIPFPDTNYYRLKQVDQDSTYRYSEIEIIRNDKGAASWIVYPNPVKDYATVRLYSDMDNIQISLYDIAGRTVYQTTQSKGTKGEEISIPVNNLTKGVYLLKLQSNQGIRTEKLLVQ